MRVAIDEKVRSILDLAYNKYADFCLSKPALTRGDSIELLVTDWLIIAFLFHKLLSEKLNFSVGLGSGTISLLKEVADECDGPAFWNARKAISEIKERKKEKMIANFILEKNTPEYEINIITNSILFLTILKRLTSQQIKYSYYYLWENKSVTEIAALFGTSRGNISKILRRSLCFTLKKVITPQENYLMNPLRALVSKKRKKYKEDIYTKH